MARIAVVTPTGFWFDDPARSTINIEYYCHALQNLGHTAKIVCPEGSRCSEAVVWESAPVEHYKDPAFWRAQEIEVVIFFCWLGYVEELEAMRAAGMTVIARGDTSGDASVRLFPWVNWHFLVGQQTDLPMRLKMLKHHADCYLRLSARYDQGTVAACRAGHRVAIETETGRQNLNKLLTHYGAGELAERIVVCPHLLSTDILTAPIPTQKCPKVVAIGRWDAYQKDAPLLEKALVRALPQQPNVAVTLIGRGASTVFSGLAQRFPKVQCVETIPRDQIKNHLSDAQVLVLSSRWESFHIAAHEALCLGATVVGPAVLPVPDILSAGDFGAQAISRTPQALADALAGELKCWEEGKRNPETIARFWRERLASEAVLARMLDGLV